ncbi:MAG: hypothetical protein SFY56_08410 [Bacteroidota bacterium]|nr:hypothetical protein [Bacteroidota bacterium]
MLHFSFVAVYALKNSNSASKISYYSTYYSYPYFHQNWNLFVPPPNSNYRLIAYTNSSEIDILKTILTEHRNNRFAGNEPLLIAVSNSIHYFEKNTLTKNCQITNDKNFAIIEHFSRNFLENEKQKLLKLLLIVTEVKTNTVKYYYN